MLCPDVTSAQFFLIPHLRKNINKKILQLSNINQNLIK